MVEFIRQIPGPVFLAVFLGFSLICIVLMRLVADADGSSHGPVNNAGIDPVGIAMLQGGVNSIIRSRVFNLMSQGLAVIEGEKKDMRVRASGKPHPGGLSPLDREVLAFLSAGRAPEELFTDKGFMASLEPHLEGIKADLQGRRLMRDEAQQARALRTALFFGALIAALGGLKLYLGLTHGKPVAFLVISIVVSEFVLLLIFKNGKTLTKAGRDYLKEIRERFKWTLKRKTLPKGVDLSFLVALYGAGHLSVISLYPQYSEAFRRTAAGTGCSGGCGSSGGCSGGNSGGCSGGGCGGCGGD